MKYSVLLFVAVLFLSGCAKPIVMPREGNVYSSTFTDKDAQTAVKKALKGAEETCKEQDKRHIVIESELNGVQIEHDSFTKVVADTTLNTMAAIGLDFRSDKTANILFRCE